MDDLRCTAAQAASAGAQSATRLGDCAFPGWGVHNCSHREDAGVVCEAPGAALASLALSYVDLAFSPATTTYRARVANAVASVTVTAVPVGDASATVGPADGDDGAEGHQVDLEEGSNTVVVTVVAAGATTTYTVVVTREAPVGRDDAGAVDGGEHRRTGSHPSATPLHRLRNRRSSVLTLNRPPFVLDHRCQDNSNPIVLGA